MAYQRVNMVKIFRIAYDAQAYKGNRDLLQII